MFKKISVALPCLFAAHFVLAGTTSVNIPVTMNIPASCAFETSQGTQVAQGGEAMRLDFQGDHFSQSATGGFKVSCTAGTSPTLKVSSTSVSGTDWSLVNNTDKNNPKTLAYHLYNDTNKTNEVQPGGALTLDANGSTTLYAVADIPEKSATGKYEGSITASLSW